jgi:DNA-binding transcriptional ArsR family regulator
MLSVADRLDRTFGALADPTRRAILARLAKGEASVTELAEPFEMSLPAVSKHLKVLEGAGLVSRGRERQWRPARLQVTPLKEVAEWTDRYRRFWEERYDRLERYLDEVQGRGPSERPSERPIERPSERLSERPRKRKEEGDGRRR